jgi:predicted double-glycine peptidase
MNSKLFFLFVFLSLFISQTQAADRRNELPTLSMSLPIYTQTTYYTCGPSTAMSVLKYFGLDKGQSEMGLATKMQTLKSTGTRYWNMIKVLNTLGLYAKAYTGVSLTSLRNALKQKEAVIVNLDDDGGHYVVLAGMTDSHVYFMDPWYAYTTYTRWDIRNFERQWYDYHNGRRYSRLGIFISKKRRK